MSTVVQQTAGSDRTAVYPFHVDVPEAELTELRRRIRSTRWPARETVTDESQGVKLAMMQNLARYWETDYDWRKVKATLNAIPQFVTNIDGLDIQFIHVRSKHQTALPLIVTHGWPYSIISMLKIIERLANPTAHGASASDAFHLVIPSLPGYGFSGKPVTTGWGPDRIASAWAVLMKRLEYTRYAAQGGDWGAIITDVMATQGYPELIGIHSNMPGAIPPDVSKAIATGSPAPAGLSDEERQTFEKLKDFFAKGAYYAYEMATRPQTLYGIADSPVGLASWLIDLGDGDAKPAAAISGDIV
jgi:pimeloyl-ACP methyl ester carboxylesterase